MLDVRKYKDIQNCIQQEMHGGCGFTDYPIL